MLEIIDWKSIKRYPEIYDSSYIKHVEERQKEYEVLIDSCELTLNKLELYKHKQKVKQDKICAWKIEHAWKFKQIDSMVDSGSHVKIFFVNNDFEEVKWELYELIYEDI